MLIWPASPLSDRHTSIKYADLDTKAKAVPPGRPLLHLHFCKMQDTGPETGMTGPCATDETAMNSTLIPAWVNGELTPVDKLYAHQLGLKHKAVSVFILRGEDILLQRRALGKYHTPGLWANTCCTHPEWDETALDCAIRRLREELGITGLIPEFRHHLEYRAPVGNGLTEHEVVDVFVAQAPDDLKTEPNKAEVMGIRWAGYREILAEMDRHGDRFTPWLKIYLRDHSGVIFRNDLDLSPLSN